MASETTPRDGDALPHLLAAMAAAGRHDGEACLRELAAAGTTLGRGRHQSRDSLDRAVAAADARDWYQVWRHAHQATKTLTWAFPPDISTCPPAPGPVPFGAPVPCPGCGTGLGDGAAFCHACGTQAPTAG